MRFEFGVLAALSLGVMSLSSHPTTAAGQEIAQRDDFVGCWMMKKPTTIAFLTDSSKKDGYQTALEFMMMQVEPMEGGELSKNLIKGSSDVWSEKGKYYIDTRYFIGSYDPVFGTIEQGARADGTSTFHMVGDQLIYVHHKSTNKSADMSVRYLDKVDCHLVAEKRTENHANYQNLAKMQDAGKLGE